MASTEPKPTQTTSSSSSRPSRTNRPTNTEGTRPGREENSGVSGSPAPGPKNSCEPTDQIVKVKSHHSRVGRDLVDYYATHLRELDRQLSASTHRGEDGKPDGMILYLPRCSLLRHVGLMAATMASNRMNEASSNA